MIALHLRANLSLLFDLLGKLRSLDGDRSEVRQSRQQVEILFRETTDMNGRIDLHGSDYTKAALRAVQDALHHSSLAFIRTLGIDKKAIDVEVTIGVQRPEKVDAEKVKASLPVGNVTVKVVKGGLDVPDNENNDPAVIASAAIAVRVPLA